jgi:hypothetical protein
LQQEYRTRPTAAVEGQFPYPVALHFQDLDPHPGRAMLHLFDFGGEITARAADTSVLRRRALRMDGFLFFLDPTQPPDRQRDAFHRFSEDVREERHVRRGRPVPVPVAVCLTKLDLIPTRTELSTRALPWLRRLRRQAAAVTLPLLEERSRLVVEALGSLCPGWNLGRELTAQFGRRWLFFPLTPVGLEESELEGPQVTDLATRTFAPFGVVEPVLWLLHMQGYQVFPAGGGGRGG